MNYSAQIREKIKNIYFQKEKIGNRDTKEKLFDFLNKYEFEPNCENQISTVSEKSYHSLIKEIENNQVLYNDLGIDFLADLEEKSFRLANFFQNTKLKLITLTPEVRIKIKNRANHIARKFGLYSLSYIIENNLTSQENLNKANLLFDKVEVELNKIAQLLKTNDLTLLGSDILNIEVNWQDISDTLAYYNAGNNSIVLKNEVSSFPLIHEYIHFLDKSTACVLLTGLTTKEAIEKKEITKQQMFNFMDMSIFSKIGFFQSTPLHVLSFKNGFSKEIQNNKRILKMFKKYDKTIDYKSQYQFIVFDHIDKKQFVHSFKMKEMIIYILNKTKIDKQKEATYQTILQTFSNEEIEIMSKTQLYVMTNNKQNLAMKWANLFDNLNSQKYFTTQKEMLARTVEKIVNKDLTTLSDELTTPTLDAIDKEYLIGILKDWQVIIRTKTKPQPKSFMLEKISAHRDNYFIHKQIIQKLK